MRKDPLAENVTSSLANRWPVTNGAGGALGTAAEEPTAGPSVERKGEERRGALRVPGAAQQHRF